jgi:hypothetical protein
MPKRTFSTREGNRSSILRASVATGCRSSTRLSHGNELHLQTWSRRDANRSLRLVTWRWTIGLLTRSLHFGSASFVLAPRNRDEQ